MLEQISNIFRHDCNCMALRWQDVIFYISFFYLIKKVLVHIQSNLYSEITFDLWDKEKVVLLDRLNSYEIFYNGQEEVGDLLIQVTA